jgi:uncharacterized Zn finger protein
MPKFIKKIKCDSKTCESENTSLLLDSSSKYYTSCPDCGAFVKYNSKVAQERIIKKYINNETEPDNSEEKKPDKKKEVKPDDFQKDQVQEPEPEKESINTSGGGAFLIAIGIGLGGLAWLMKQRRV